LRKDIGIQSVAIPRTLKVQWLLWTANIEGKVARDLAIGRHALAFSRQPRERIDVLDAVANRRPLR
jgi:hypothetical protein